MYLHTLLHNHLRFPHHHNHSSSSNEQKPPTKIHRDQNLTMISHTSLHFINFIQSIILLSINTSFSYISIPATLLSPSPILAIRQWKSGFDKGLKTAFPLSITALVLSAILAYTSVSESRDTTFWLYALSTLLSFLIFPFTEYYIQPLNRVLVARYEEQLQLHYADLPEKNAGMQTARVSFLFPLSQILVRIGGTVGLSIHYPFQLARSREDLPT